MNEDTKNRPPLELPGGRDARGAVRLYLELAHLKQRYRRGWLRRGVPAGRCESVADHVFGVALLALFLLDDAPPELDREKTLRLALLHDLGEVHAGDAIPADGLPDEIKHRREAESVERLLAGWPGGERHAALWREYAAGRCPEARFVRQLDRLEMALQSLVYELQGHGDLSEFRASAAGALERPELRRILDDVEALAGGRPPG